MTEDYPEVILVGVIQRFDEALHTVVVFLMEGRLDDVNSSIKESQLF